MDDIYDYVTTFINEVNTTRVLDIGCGDGTLGLYLREYEFTGIYQGIDKNPIHIAETKSKGLKATEGDLKWLDYHKYTWDVVVMQDVVEHLDNISLLTNAIPIARRFFILTTETVLIDSIAPIPRGHRYFHVDDLISMAAVCSFRLKDYQQIGNHSVLIFKRKRKR